MPPADSKLVLEMLHLPSPEHVLKTVFGYDSFRGQQKDVIDAIMCGKHVCALMPTGAGKSLCYQIPALCRPGVGIVVSPLIALMQDQVSALRELGIRAAMLNSALDYGQMQDVLRNLQAGALDLLYIAPERLMTEGILDMLDDVEIALFAIDEAHCVSQWGHDFRPEYRAIRALYTRYPHVPRIAVTATADAPTRKDIMAQLHLERIFVAGFDRPNIRYDVQVKANSKRQLLEFLQGRQSGESGIVYCLSRKKTEEIAAFLTENSFTAMPYHAGMDSRIRAKHQDRFIKEEGIIIVATIAFGMGINKPDVRFVAHLDLPSNIEAYYQETGRAGRDGLPASAIMFYGLQDVAMRRQMINVSDAPAEQKRIEHQKLNALIGYCEAGTCRRQILLNYFGDEGTPCGNCDTCHSPPAMMDGTTAAQKIISTIYRTGQLFGGKHIVDVILGKETQQTQKHAHQRLSVWGIGTEYNGKTWESFIRQLVASNLLGVDSEGHGGLYITPDGADFLKEKRSILFIIPSLHTGRPEKKISVTNLVSSLETDQDKRLFDNLKSLRLTLARDHNLPPYVIFHDKTLLSMAARRPLTLDAFAQIPGVGQSKLDKYGEVFLSVIREAV